MTNSIFLAKLLGPYFIVVCLGVLLNRDNYLKLIDDFVNNAGLRYIGGLLALVFGLLVVINHNVWESSWVVIITIIGWMGLIKGSWILIFPNRMSSFVEVYKKNNNFLTVSLSIFILLGVFLSFKGYF